MRSRKFQIFGAAAAPLFAAVHAVLGVRTTARHADSTVSMHFVTLMWTSATVAALLTSACLAGLIRQSALRALIVLAAVSSLASLRLVEPGLVSMTFTILDVAMLSVAFAFMCDPDNAAE